MSGVSAEPGVASRALPGGGRLVRQTGGMAASLYVSRFAVLARGLLAARLLGPAVYGIWNALQLIWEYGQFAHLGVLNGLNKEIAFRLGTGEREEARRLTDAAFGSMLATALIGWLALAAVLVLRYRGQPDGAVWIAGGCLAGVVVIVEEVLLLYVSVLRAHGGISLVSSTEFLYAIVNLAASVATLVRFGLPGLLVAWLVTRTAALVWFVRRSGLTIRPRWDRARTVHLLRRGGWIFVFLALAALMRTIDRPVTLSRLGVESLGYYGIAATVAGLVAMIPNAVTFVIYPVFLKSYGETRDRKALRRELERATLALAAAIPLLVVVLALLVPAAIAWVLPKYLQAVPAMRLLLAGSLFAAVCQVPVFYLLAIDRDPRLVAMSAAGAVVSVVLCLAAVHAGWGMAGVAAGKAVADTLYGIAVIAYAGSLAGRGAISGVSLVARCLAPALVVLLAVAASALLLGAPAWQPSGADAARSLARTGTSLALAAPFLWHYARRNDLVSLWTGLIARRRPAGATGVW